MGEALHSVALRLDLSELLLRRAIIFLQAKYCMVLSETMRQKLNYPMRRLFLLYKDVRATQRKGNSRFKGLSAMFLADCPKTHILSLWPIRSERREPYALCLRPILL